MRNERIPKSGKTGEAAANGQGLRRSEPIDPLEALWRRDLAAFNLGNIAKKPTAFGKKMERERNKAIEFNLREIIACQQALGEDATPHIGRLQQFLELVQPKQLGEH